MKYKLLIFDMDGTILDTLKDLQNCINHALKLSGYPERTLDEVRSFVGNGLAKLVERAVPKEATAKDCEKVFSDLKAFYKEHCTDYTKPYDGIVETIRDLKLAGYKTAVVSNKADFAVQDLVKEYFDGLFDVSVGEKEGRKKKPAPDSVYYVLDTLHISKEDAIYIGDSEVDIETAKNAEIDSIIVEWGFRDKAFLVEKGANVFAKEPADIVSILSHS